jgi:hypothetical protein
MPVNMHQWQIDTSITCTLNHTDNVRLSPIYNSCKLHFHVSVLEGMRKANSYSITKTTPATVLNTLHVFWYFTFEVQYLYNFVHQRNWLNCDQMQQCQLQKWLEKYISCFPWISRIISTSLIASYYKVCLRWLGKVFTTIKPLYWFTTTFHHLINGFVWFCSY